MPSLIYTPNLKYSPRTSAAENVNGVMTSALNDDGVDIWKLDGNTLTKYSNASPTPGERVGGPFQLSPNKRWLAIATETLYQVYEINFFSGYVSRTAYVASGGGDGAAISSNGLSAFFGSDGSGVLAYPFDDENGTLGSAFGTPALSFSGSAVRILFPDDGGVIWLFGSASVEAYNWTSASGWGSKLTLATPSTITSLFSSDVSRLSGANRWVAVGYSGGFQICMVTSNVGGPWSFFTTGAETVRSISFSGLYVAVLYNTSASTRNLQIYSLSTSAPFATFKIGVGFSGGQQIHWLRGTNRIFVTGTSRGISAYDFNPVSNTLTEVSIGASDDGSVGIAGW